MLTEPEGYALLGQYGIPVPPYRVVTGEEDAAAAAESIGYPVVIKVVSPDIVHKSDAGGVVTGIGNETELRQAYAAMMGRLSAAAPDAAIHGVIVERHMPPGLELIVGGKTDPAFGKVLTFGIGGTLVELVRDLAIRVLPLAEEEFAEMVRSIRGYPLIAGFRGEAPRDEAALLEMLSRIAAMFLVRDDLVEFDINPLMLYESGGCAVDARVIAGSCGETACAAVPKTEIDTAVFYPSAIALVGASTNPNKIGYAVFRNLLAFDGTVYPVNPNADTLLGRKVYSSLADIPERVDMVVIAVPAALVPGVVEEAGRAGVRLAAIISAGFKETGPAGAELERQVVENARRYGLRVIGPNCLGIMLPHRGLNATFDPSAPRPGPIAFISQSGAVITTVVDWSLAEEIGISAVISVGNQADLEFEDFLQFAEEDPDTKAMVLYVEEIKNGRQFLSFARTLSGTKPIIAIKSGSSARGRKAASSHTGSLAGSYEVYRAAFRQAGVIAAHSLRDAFEVAGLVASEGYPRGPRAVIITSAGGFAVLSSDYAEENGIECITFSDSMIAEFDAILPPGWSRGNPLDMVGDAGVDRYARIFDILIRHQDAWDVCFVISVPSVTIDAAHLAQEIVRFSKNTHKMIVGCLLGGESMRAGIRILRTAHIPNFSELEDAFRAVGTALDRKSWDAPR
ncbi:MAG: CoA-binding protein [Methanomicrobiales archaeon]|nr:CoA-binding protein [Methanomicrobiales archaeon]